MGMGDGVTSIAWSGASLLLSSRSGAVSFLLPFPSIHSLSSLPSDSLRNNEIENEDDNGYHHSMIQSLGFRLERTDGSSTDNRSLSYGLLCSLPRHLTSSGRSARMRNTFSYSFSISFHFYFSFFFFSLYSACFLIFISCIASIDSIRFYFILLRYILLYFLTSFCNTLLLLIIVPFS